MQDVGVYFHPKRYTHFFYIKINSIDSEQIYGRNADNLKNKQKRK